MSNFLVKQSYEFIWHFTYTEKNGICFSKMTDERFSEYETLLKEGRRDFDVIIDDNNEIHLVCQDDKGGVVYLHYENKNWHKSVILQSKTPTSYEKHFRILKINTLMHVFYIIEHNGKRMLTHQMFENPPTAIDYVQSGFNVCTDIYNNILIFYVNESSVFGCKKYMWNKKEWSGFTPIEGGNGCKSCCALTDKSNNLYIALEKEDGVWLIRDDNAVKLGIGTTPVLFAEENTLWCIWLSGGAIQAKSSVDQGETWKSSGSFVSGRTQSHIRFALRYTSEDKNLNASACYGFISGNVIRLYLLNKFFLINRIPIVSKEKLPGDDVAQFAKEMGYERQETVNKQENIEISRLAVHTSEIINRLTAMQRKIDKIEEGVNLLFKKQSENIE